MYMILVGGGNVGLQLAKRLLSRGHEVLVVEREPRQSTRLCSLIGDENVFLGDGCEMMTQKECGFGRADVVVAITGEDEDNLVICQMAKVVWNVDRVVARVNDPSHEVIFAEIGIDDTVSATGIIYSLIEQQITPDVMLPVGALNRGDIEVVEVQLSSRSPVVNRPIREIQLPPQTMIVWLLREDHGLMVTGDTVLQVRDTIVALVPRSSAEALREILMPTTV
jgi:trk system potassium uptake protein TrkA